MEQIFITGHIGSDAETKQTSDNQFLTHFSVACSRQWAEKDTGEIKKTTNWYTVFRRTSKHPEKLLNHLKKGNKVLVTGQPSYSINTHGNGVKCEVTIQAKDIEVQTFTNSPEKEVEDSKPETKSVKDAQ